MSTRDLVVLSGGHPFDEPAFDALLARLDGWRVHHWQHPEAEARFAAGEADAAPGLLFYDMPGYMFVEGRVVTRPPDPGFVRAFEARLARGAGAVAMHHALAGWAEWEGWAHAWGGRFLYQPGVWNGRAVPDSGYRHDVAYRADVVCDHPVTAGVPASFMMTDEVYLAEIDEAAITPLVRARHAFVRDNFWSAAAAVAGRMFDHADWDHAPGSDCVAWARRHGAANLVYLQCGDGPEAYANPAFVRLLNNALAFSST